MTQTEQKKLSHLEWAIRSRTRNQQCAVHLLRLFYDFQAQWNTKPWAAAAQELLSASFSLWRSAFLADKKAKRSEVFSDATEFLERIIEDNAISYAQDKKCNEWTFNYYTRNARASLEALHKHWPEQSPAYVTKKRAPTERWEYCQDLLDQAVANFETLALKIRNEPKIKSEKAYTRLASQERRKKVRAYTIENRAIQNGKLA